MNTAADLIDIYLQAEPPSREKSARLRQIRFPAALEWLRIEDVIRLARTSASDGGSRKAFFNRWPTKDDFLADVVVYAAMREHADDDPREYVRHLSTLQSAPSFAAAIATVVDGLLESLIRHPRSYLTLHLGPLLPQHPKLWAALLQAMRADIQMWAAAYETTLRALGLELRPEWTCERLSLALLAMIDGCLLRARVQPNDFAAARHDNSSLLADSVTALVIGVIDWDRAGQTGRDALDTLVRSRRGHRPSES